jgi:hypothetical protein
LLAATVSVIVPPAATDVGDIVAVIPLIVPVITLIGTVAVCPLALAVIVAAPAAMGVTVTDAPVVVAVQPGLLNEITAQLVSELVQFGETLAGLLLTVVPLAESVRLPAPLAELRTAPVGLTAKLANEFGETKKPSQPTSMSAIAVKPMNARTAAPIRDIAPPEHTLSS